MKSSKHSPDKQTTEENINPRRERDSARIVTDEFTLGPNIHARQVIMRRAARFWMAGALPVAALVICGLAYDSRMLFVAAAVALLLFPILLFFGWYGLLTRPWAIASLFPQRVTVDSDNEIAVEYRSEEPRTKPADLVIKPEDISGCHLSGNYLVITYADSRDLIIPLSAFTDQMQITQLLNRLDR